MLQKDCIGMKMRREMEREDRGRRKSVSALLPAV